MSQIQSLRVFLNQRLTAAAEEIFGAVEKTIAEYQEEISRSKDENVCLRRMLDIRPEIKLFRADAQPLTATVSETVRKIRAPVWGNRRTKSTHIKEEQEEIHTSPNEEELQADLYVHTIFPPSCVNSDHDEETVNRNGAPVQGSRRTQSTHIKEVQEEIQTSQKEEDLQADLHTHTIFPPACVNGDHGKDPTQSSHEDQTQSGEDTYREALPSTSSEQIEIEIGFDGKDSMVSEPSRHIQTTESLKVMQTVNNIPSYCKVCGIPCRSKASLIDHAQIHTNEQQHCCGVCGNRFGSTKSVIDHLKTHIGRNVCPICGKYFSQKNLKVHIMVHTGDKPHSCQFCGKGYTQRGNLKAHIRTHTGEKPYNCHVCGRCFVHSSQRIVHMRTRTGEKPFRCRFCSKGFAQISGLQSHMMVHTKEKPHSCHLCGKTFSLKNNMLAHIKCHNKHTKKGETASSLSL